MAVMTLFFKLLQCAAPALLLAGCGNLPATPEDAPIQMAPPLAGADIGGPFELVDQTGATVRWNDFEGKWRMVYFGYAYCPDVCPFDVNRMMAGYDAFAREHPDLADDVQPIFITVDPERDTPAVVGEFAANFSPRLLALTGTPEQVRAAADEFSVYYEKGEPNEEGGYLVNHSNAAYLMDRQGEPIALLPVDESAENVAAELATWVN